MDWGLLGYQEALERQLDWLDGVVAGKNPEAVIFCRHHPVVTTGAKPVSLSGWTGEVVRVRRGGLATYHGPNQLVIYPIIKLQQGPKSIGDVKSYLDFLFLTFSKALARWNVDCSPEPEVLADEYRGLQTRGVWVGSRKLASMGIGIKRWTTYHGAAINLNYDPSAFQGINPCGFSPRVMISLEELVLKPVSHEDFADLFWEELCKVIA